MSDGNDSEAERRRLYFEGIADERLADAAWFGDECHLELRRRVAERRAVRDLLEPVEEEIRAERLERWRRDIVAWWGEA